MEQNSNCSWPQLAIASVPLQKWQQTYRPEEAFQNGTIFPELNLPFNGYYIRQEKKR